MKGVLPPKAEATGSNPVGCATLPSRNLQERAPNKQALRVQTPYKDDDSEARMLRYGDPPLVVVGSPSRGFTLHRRLGEKMVPLAGETLDKAYYNAAMGILSVTDEDDLFKGRREPTREPKAGHIYFIGGDVGAIKIGFAGRPEFRLKDLQCGSPIPLRILATVAGMPSVERDYHKRFAAYRLHREWFERCPEIEAEIERLNA